MWYRIPKISIMLPQKEICVSPSMSSNSVIKMEGAVNVMFMTVVIHFMKVVNTVFKLLMSVAESAVSQPEGHARLGSWVPNQELCSSGTRETNKTVADIIKRNVFISFVTSAWCLWKKKKRRFNWLLFKTPECPRKENRAECNNKKLAKNTTALMAGGIR
jgi:hypothetical protein